MASSVGKIRTSACLCVQPCLVWPRSSAQLLNATAGLPYTCCVLRAVAVVVTIVAVSAKQSEPVAVLLNMKLDTKYLLLCLVATLWGIARSGGNVVDSSFADSIPTGAEHTLFLGLTSVQLRAHADLPAKRRPEMLLASAGQRSEQYTRLFSAANVANGIGPAISIGVFLATGNDWTRHALEARLRDRGHGHGN